MDNSHEDMKNIKCIFIFFTILLENAILPRIEGSDEIDFSALKPLPHIEYEKTVQAFGFSYDISDVYYILKPKTPKHFSQFTGGFEILWKYGIYTSINVGISDIQKSNTVSGKKYENTDVTRGEFITLSIGKRFGKSNAKFTILKGFIGGSDFLKEKYNLSPIRLINFYGCMLFPYWGIGITRQYSLFKIKDSRCYFKIELVLKWSMPKNFIDNINTKLGFAVKYDDVIAVPYWGWKRENLCTFLPNFELRISLDYMFHFITKDISI